MDPLKAAETAISTATTLTSVANYLLKNNNSHKLNAIEQMSLALGVAQARVVASIKGNMTDANNARIDLTGIQDATITRLTSHAASVLGMANSAGMSVSDTAAQIVDTIDIYQQYKGQIDAVCNSIGMSPSVVTDMVQQLSDNPILSALAEASSLLPIVSAALNIVKTIINHKKAHTLQQQTQAVQKQTEELQATSHNLDTCIGYMQSKADATTHHRGVLGLSTGLAKLTANVQRLYRNIQLNSALSTHLKTIEEVLPKLDTLSDLIGIKGINEGDIAHLARAIASQQPSAPPQNYGGVPLHSFGQAPSTLGPDTWDSGSGAAALAYIGHPPPPAPHPYYGTVTHGYTDAQLPPGVRHPDTWGASSGGAVPAYTGPPPPTPHPYYGTVTHGYTDAQLPPGVRHPDTWGASSGGAVPAYTGPPPAHHPCYGTVTHGYTDAQLPPGVRPPDTWTPASQPPYY